MRVLMLVPWNMFPINNGAAMRYYDTAEALSGRVRLEVTSPKSKPPEYEGKGFIPTNLEFPITYTDTLIDRIMGRISTTNPIVKGLQYFRPWQSISILRNSNEIPDVVHAEHIFSALNGIILSRMWGKPLVLVLHNAEHMLIEQIHGKALGRLSRFLIKHLLKWVDKVVCVSESDREAVQKDMGIDGIEVVPNSINLRRYHVTEAVIDAERSKLGFVGDRAIVFFHGLLSYPPNSEAVSVIEQRIAPRVLHSNKNVIFLIAGASPPPRSKIEEGIRFIGSVDRIEPYIQMADVCIACLVRGSGTKLKVLEYMGSGRAVVATSKAIEGIDVTEGKDVYIRDDWNEFADAILLLLNNPAERIRLGQEAKHLIESKYNWDLNAESLLRTYKSLRQGV
jgi:glycosyltransferase involved in cell wall biosynthesis